MEKDLYIVIESQADAEDPTVMNHKVKLGERIKRQNIDVMDIFRKVAEIMNYRSVMEMINMHFPEHRPQPNRQQQPGVLDVTEGGASQISHPGIPMATSTPFPETSSQFLNTYRPKRLPR
ncbi:unnamed protein product [Cyprideis torosa]|uniref:Uncharacterized protein n=1 Tax=Cyprideis torosa TaxID=163714 RepID=A0A7R8WWP9_9CRUS|nr:unnamed protein product [Cyprideis torosa]CAG0908655.1 unnamed protein product [Cyprideis torosa]